MTASPPKFRTFTAQEKGVGGLLLLFVITQVVAVLIVLYHIPAMLAAFDSTVWTTIGLAVPAYRPVVIVEAIVHGLRILLPVTGLVLIWRRDRRTIAFYSGFLVFLIVWGIGDHLAALRVYRGVLAMLEQAHRSTDRLQAAQAQGWTQTYRTISYAAIWLFYWRTSTRVRATFGPPATAPSPTTVPAGPK